VSNKGLIRGFDGKKAQGIKKAFVANDPADQRSLGPLIWTSTRQIGNAIADATSITADKNWALTLGLDDATSAFGNAGIPLDGGVVGLSVLAIGRNTAVGASERLLLADYSAPSVRVGDAPNAQHGQELYFGKVAGHYNSLWVPIVYTGGINNLQFKWAVGWTAGTSTVYLRITGYWQQEDDQ